jgi:hypothetical protein
MFTLKNMRFNAIQVCFSVSYEYEINKIALFPIFGVTMLLLKSRDWISEERRQQLGGPPVDFRERNPF